MKRAGSKRPKSGVVKIGRASGRVKCFIRVRPLNSDELERGDECAVDISHDKKEVLVNDTRVGLDKNFRFDHVFPEETTNPQIANFISKPLVNAALNGFNGTVMAYGQTGSGKTYTLMSPDGVAATIIEKSFRKMAAKEKLQYKVSMSYLQIYQEKIYDLLNNAASNKIDLTIREHPQKGIYVENLSEYVVRSPEEVHSLLQLGKKRLVFAETKMNRTSSRSHSVCILSIERSSKHSDQTSSPTKLHFDKKLHATLVSEGVDTPSKTSLSKAHTSDGESSDSEEEDDALSKMMAFNEDVVLKGHLYICDLAGSERIKKTKAEGERLNEAQSINLSLLELGNVIQALAEGAESGRTGHIPFRNSTLTRLLQESLGGNCKTSLVVCCSPADVHVHETKCSLGFGSRAMKVTNTAYVNVEMDYKKLSDDLAKLVDAREKEIEELKASRQHELLLSKKEAEMAAEMKFGDGLNEARKAYVALKHLLDSQASSHAEGMAQLQGELSREKDAKLALQEQLSNKTYFSKDSHCRTKCLLLTEVLSMQLFYTLQCTADNASYSELFDEDSQEQMKEDVVDTQEEILENVDNLIGVLGTYLNLSEKEFSDGEDEEFDSEEEMRFSDSDDFDGKLSDLQSLVVKIRKRLSVLKDSVDGRTLRFLKGVVDRKDQTSMENMQDVYQVLQKLLTTRRESNDPDFLENSKDAERCLTYVLLDKALLCCLVVLQRYQTEKNFLELGAEKDALARELETVRLQNKSMKNENKRLTSQLEKHSSDEPSQLHSKARVNVRSGDNRKAVETLLAHNAKLQLQIDNLQRELGSKRGRTSEETGKDLQICYLRQQVSELTRENEKLEFMMKIMGERFSQGDFIKPQDSEHPISEKKDVERPKYENCDPKNLDIPRREEKQSSVLQETKVTSTGSGSITPVIEEKEAGGHIKDGNLKEKLLTNKIETEKTLKQLLVIKVDEKIHQMNSTKRCTTDASSTKPEPEKLEKMLDTAIESVQTVDVNTGLILNSSLKDIEVLERDINAMKVNNEALGRECLSLVNYRQKLKALLSDLHGNIAGLQGKVVDKDDPTNPTLPNFEKTDGCCEGKIEIKTEVYSSSTTSESPLKKRNHHQVNAQSQENELTGAANGVSLREFINKDIQTDVTFIKEGENDSESDGLEENATEELRASEVVQKLVKKYCLVKQLVKHLESEIGKFKIRTTALETELKERQHLKDENMLLEEEVKELQGLKIYLETQLAEGSGQPGEASDDFRPFEEESNLKMWKNYEERDSLSDLSASSHLSTSQLNLTSTPTHRSNYHNMSRSMLDLSHPQMYTSFSSLKSSRGSFGSLKMLKLEMEGQPSRSRDKLKSTSLLLQHTGSLESQLKSWRKKCFRLEGEVCKLVKEKKDISEELDKMRAKLVEESTNNAATGDSREKSPEESTPFGSKSKRRSFRFKRGKEEKDRLKNELSLAKEQLSKLKSQLEIARPAKNDSPERRSSYSTLSEDEKRRERELALTRERCRILAEELGASNKEKIKLGDELQEALDNIDFLANDLRKMKEEKGQLEIRMSELEDSLASSPVNEKLRAELKKLRSDISDLLQEKENLEESVIELRWEKEKINEMESIVKRLMQVEEQKSKLQGTQGKEGGNSGTTQDREELIRLRNENEQLRSELHSLNDRVQDVEYELETSTNTSLTKVLNPVKDDKPRLSSQSKVDRGSRGVTQGSKERGGLEKKSRSKALPKVFY